MLKPILLTDSINFDIRLSPCADGKTKAESQILQELRTIADYDEVRGYFRAITIRRGSNQKYGDPLGSIRPRKHTAYRLISMTVDNEHKQWLEHQLVWLWHTGELPNGRTQVIDHIDHNGLNNRVENLRLVSSAINARNQVLRENSNSSVLGVSYHKHSGKWRALLIYEQKTYLKYCDTLQAAIDARRSFEKIVNDLGANYHEFHGNTINDS